MTVPTAYPAKQRTRVVIVGGGFAGIEAAKALRRADVQVVLIDRSNHHLFQPLLYQVATASLSPADIAAPIRSILRSQRNAETVLDEVVGVDANCKLVHFADWMMPYDKLILAVGATHSYFNHPEWEQTAPGLKTVDDATHIRRKILIAYERAEQENSASARRAWTTFVIVGGGPTGVEMAGSLAELSRRVINRDFRHISPEQSSIILVEAGPRLLSSFPPELSERARRDLEEMGVDVRLNSMVDEVDEFGVSIENARVEARTVVWAAGVRAAPVARWLELEPGPQGKVRVGPDLQALPDVYVVGDCALLEQDGAPLPGVAQVAMQQGRYAARHAIGLEPREFRYFDKGNMATIGRRRAVAQIGRLKFGGGIAWLLWAFIHIMSLVEFRSRLSVLLQWIWSYVTWERGARLITGKDSHC